jgi:hypothetical protein
MAETTTARPAGCPEWCTRRHDDRPAEDDQVHISGALQVRRTILRLVATVDPDSRNVDGPFVMVGDHEYTLHEADVLIAALTQLVDEGRAVSQSGVPRMRPPGP